MPALCLALGLAFGGAAAMGSVVAPVNITPPSISGEPAEGGSLTASPGTWENDPTSFAYQWQVNDEESQWHTIGGATTNSYSPAFADVGFKLRVVVTASNAAGDSIPKESSETADVYTPIPVPVNVSPPIINSSGAIDSTAELFSVGGWEGEPTSYTYQWYRAGIQLDGETNTTWTVAGNLSDEFYLVVTAHNDGGASAPTPSAPLYIT